jgi:hypothetical protein
MDGSAALALYREEKARALQERRISHAQLMAEAKEAFAKMLADGARREDGGGEGCSGQEGLVAQGSRCGKARESGADEGGRGKKGNGFNQEARTGAGKATGCAQQVDEAAIVIQARCARVA